jgi:hypothetical protein
MKRNAAVVIGAIALIAFFGVSNAAGQQVAIPKGEVVLLDDFEDGNFWAAVGSSWDQWGNHNLSLEAELSTAWGTAGGTSADWVFDTIPVKGGQATFFCDQLLVTDWTKVKYVAVDVNNPNKFTLTLEFNTQSTDGWAWTATKDVQAAPGVSTAVFDFTSGLLDGNNAPVKGIPGPDKMKRAMITVRFAEGQAGRFSVDNIRLIQ